VNEVQKVNIAFFSLKNIALVWWHYTCDDVNRWSPPITTWDGLKRELKEQLYTKDVEKEAKAKLRRLQHKDGHICEYIKEAYELLLDIPSMWK